MPAKDTMYESKVPVRSELISWVQFLEITGCHPSRLGELIEMGWLEPVSLARDAYVFSVRDVYRVRKLERLCQDFDLTCVGASIIVDLLLRIDALERKVRDLETLAR